MGNLSRTSSINFRDADIRHPRKFFTKSVRFCFIPDIPTDEPHRKLITPSTGLGIRRAVAVKWALLPTFINLELMAVVALGHPAEKGCKGKRTGLYGVVFLRR